MAQTLTRRVQSAEQRSAKAIEQVGGEIARIAGAVEHRLSRVDQLHAEALERLGAEIGRITERLTDRIMQSERRAAQAIDDVGEQVAKVTERIEQRHERAADDVAERLRQSEARMAHLLRTAQTDLGDAASDPRSMTEDERDAEFPASTAVFGPELFSRAEPATPPALDPGNPAFAAEDFDAADSFAPISEVPIFQTLSRATLDAGFTVGGPPIARPPIAGAAPGERDLTVPPADRAVADTAGGEPAELESASDRFDLEAPPAQGEPRPLSTRDVIEQARAIARAAAAAPRPKSLQAPERDPRSTRGGGLFGALKPGRPASTWQTALMVAGGAAFLSVGAAGVVLMEGPAAGPDAGKAQIHRAEVHQAPLFGGAPRAALAMSPQPAPPAHAVAVDRSLARPGADTVAADYLNTARAVERKQPGAIAHLKALADAGHPPAQVFLARLYETGQAGVVQNLAEARRWTARAADAGDPSAMHNLALYYFRGEGGPQDAAAAASWFKKAAQHGVVDSQYNLGLLYQSGSGVPRDLAQAYKWFSIAANGGDGEARNSAMDLEAKLPAAQLASAESQAAAFAPTSAAPTPENLAYGPSIAAAQKILGRLGYYKGRPDGTTSRDLKLAVAAYQRDQGLAATGSLDPATVSRLSVFTR
ncbi:peptidoglycan-binding protein [Phenylobacterium sp.]|uniref:peptidoglycan-binding protein n=1 Tax=Phenylobacterium sp. TaxID=1871053 RepID=UPI002869EE89|nr:peptidoglycan-binding protein [Phenylobacterium sp.]